MNIPFHKPMTPKSFDKIYPESITNGWLTTGPEVRSFEYLLSDFAESDFAIAVNSCTAALHLVGSALGWRPDDIILTSPITFLATANCIVYAGATPDFVDINPMTNTISLLISLSSSH